MRDERVAGFGKGAGRGLVAVLVACVLLAVGGKASAAALKAQWEGPLGHVFDTGQAVQLTLKPAEGVPVDSVQWTVFDFWHRQVESGNAPAQAGACRIEPRIGAVGYYLLHAVALQGDVAAGDAYTSFAIVRAHVSPDPANSPFGVMTHFAQGMDPAMLPLFKRIGIQSIRDEHYWADVERTKGEYRFSERSDAYMRACAEAGIDPLIVMSFGNKHYDSPKGPSTPAGFAGYARYGQAILDHYGKQVRWLEVWNEYNGTWCPDEAKQDRPRYYTQMLKAAYERIKAVRPDVQVLGGAAVLIPLPYFKGIFEHGGLDCMDGVVIHPYRGRPEGVDEEVRELKELIRTYNNGKDKPIWVTETGRHTRDEYDWESGRKMYEKGRAEGARYLARQYTLLLKENVARIYWYLASDHADFVSMGLLRHHKQEASGMGELAVAPAYVAYANLIHHLDGARFVQREAERPYSRVHVYRFDRGGEPVRIAWATQPAKIRVKADRPLRIANLMGTESEHAPAGGEVLLDLSEEAIFFRGPVESIEEVDTGVHIIADSLDDYSKTQGRNGWRYGYVLDGDKAFRELTQVETMWGYTWGGVSKYLTISGTQMHPDRIGGKDALPVVRWTSPVEGKLGLEGRFTRGDKGDGVIAVIRVDGREVYTQPIGGPGPGVAEVNLAVEVQRGSTIDLLVRPGKSVDHDSTQYELRIVQR